MYKGEHSGWYSVSDECFYTESQIKPAGTVPGEAQTMVSIETGSTVEWSQEENYKFRLGQFREPLLKWLNENRNCEFFPVYCQQPDALLMIYLNQRYTRRTESKSYSNTSPIPLPCPTSPSRALGNGYNGAFLHLMTKSIPSTSGSRRWSTI